MAQEDLTLSQMRRIKDIASLENMINKYKGKKMLYGLLFFSIEL
jgi:hypothetical protein